MKFHFRNRLLNKTTTGKSTASPTKRSSMVNGKTQSAATGPKIAKPVQKPTSSSSSSPAAAKSAAGAAKAKATAVKSRLPQPSPSRIPQATSLKSLNQRQNVAAKAPASSPHSRHGIINLQTYSANRFWLAPLIVKIHCTSEFIEKMFSEVIL